MTGRNIVGRINNITYCVRNSQVVLKTGRVFAHLKNNRNTCAGDLSPIPSEIPKFIWIIHISSKSGTTYDHSEIGAAFRKNPIRFHNTHQNKNGPEAADQLLLECSGIIGGFTDPKRACCSYRQPLFIRGYWGNSSLLALLSIPLLEAKTSVISNTTTISNTSKILGFSYLSQP